MEAKGPQHVSGPSHGLWVVRGVHVNVSGGTLWQRMRERRLMLAAAAERVAGLLRSARTVMLKKPNAAATAPIISVEIKNHLL